MKKKIFFASSKKKGVGSRVGSGDQEPDPDPHQNVTDPQHWLGVCNTEERGDLSISLICP
jgi:hypothetical protein